MTITTDLVVAFCTGLLTIAGVLGLAVRFILLPYLREHLVRPMAEVRGSVVNDHKSNLREDVDAIAGKLEEMRGWLTVENGRLWSAISRKADK